MAECKIDFSIAQSTVASVSLEIADLTRSLGNRRFHTQSSGAHYHLQPPWHVEAQWRDLRHSNRYQPQHVLGLDAVRHDEEHNIIELNESAVVFNIRERTPDLVQVSAECRFQAIADGFSSILRGLASFGGAVAQQSLCADAFQAQLREITTAAEHTEWDSICLDASTSKARPEEQVSPPAQLKEQETGPEPHPSLVELRGFLQDRQAVLERSERARDYYEPATACAVANALVEAKKSRPYEHLGAKLISQFCMPKLHRRTVGHYLQIFRELGIQSIKEVNIPPGRGHKKSTK